MNIKTNLLAMFLVLGSIPSNAAEGKIYVDFTFKSTTKSITIHGEAATLLYNTLTLAPDRFGDAKVGTNLSCLIHPWLDPKHPHECKLAIDEKGNALKLR